jgi:hypothetical protein
MDIKQLNEDLNKILTESVELNEHKIFYYMVEMYRKYYSLKSQEEKDSYIEYKEQDLADWDKDVNYAEAVKRFKELIVAPFRWELSL